MSRRCGCASNVCACFIAASTNGSVVVTGTGSANDPYRIDMGAALLTDVAEALALLLPPALEGAPMGVLGYAEHVANQNAITSVEVPVTGLTSTVTVPAGRRLRITGHLPVVTAASDMAACRANLRIHEGVNTYSMAYVAAPLSVVQHTLTAIAVITPTAGVHTYFLAVNTIAGGSVDLTMANQSPGFILVEDIGI